MDRKTAKKRVAKVIAEHLGIAEEKVTKSDTASLIDDFGADSLDNVELVMALEEEFSMRIPDDAAESMLTLQDIYDFVAKNAPDV